MTANTKLNIYLADLFHTDEGSHSNQTYTVPLAVAYLAAFLKKAMPEVQVRLFRDPDQLLAALDENVPHVLGFNLCSWNSNLSWQVARWIKERNPEVITVAGGASVDDHDEQLVSFFESFPQMDYVVPNEGETGFLALIQHIVNGRHREDVIPGVAYLGADGKLVRGAYAMPEMDTIPSPYLSGMLDPFLAQGLVPIIQTMRGCPYRCDFCVSGMNAWDKVRAFDTELVKAEIDYAFRHGKVADLVLTDENWGILGDRDVEIARYILEHSRDHGKPTRVYYYTAKVVNDASRTIAEMISPISWVHEFSMSYQSLNPETRKAIRRTNIPLEKLAFNIHWANGRSIPTSSEMIWGFPYETLETFVSGVETLLVKGVHKIQIYPLQLFPGVDLDSTKCRELYGFRTMFRITDGGYGVYGKDRLVGIETEEVVVQTKWSKFQDFLDVRRYAFFVMMMLGRGYFSEFVRLCADMKVATAFLPRHLTFADYTNYPALGRIMDDYNRAAKDELKESREEVLNDFRKRMLAGEEIQSSKLNLIYMGKIFSSASATKELIAFVGAYYDKLLADKAEKEVLSIYLKEVLPNRIVMIAPEAQKTHEFKSRFDYVGWHQRRGEFSGELILSKSHNYSAEVSDVLLNMLATVDVLNPTSLQNFFDKTPSKHLMATVVPLP